MSWLKIIRTFLACICLYKARNEVSYFIKYQQAGVVAPNLSKGDA